ncbi:hypothetical protein [Streptomyces sp. NPDC006134]|uniref:hypothetical protein n=1 Tax=Streptomyces sp. NPDC006134 TaxID=3154467 RepID=UPI0033E6647B
MASIGPPATQEGVSGFDPAQENPPLKFGVWGDTSKGHAVIGSSGKPVTGAGVFGVNVTNSGVGVLGHANGDNAAGVAGFSSTGIGVSGTSTSGTGVKAASPSGVGLRTEGATGIVATGTQVAGHFSGDVGIGTDAPSAALEIDRGQSDDIALLLKSSGSGWGSGLQLTNEAGEGCTVGMRPGTDGAWHFTDVLADTDRLVIDAGGRIGVGTDTPRLPLHVEGALHSAGDSAGLSFEDRSAGEFIEDPGTGGGRWMWYASEGSARLWSGTDRLTIHPGQGGGLDVPRRMRIRQGDDGSAGVWLNQKGVGDRAFIGMLDDDIVGFFGVGAVKWGLRMNVNSGETTVIGPLVKAGGGFKIDHPLDPAHRYLSHSFVESPDMTNLYDGTVVTDENGEATVELPGYFEALNRDYRCQLTPMGELAIAAVTGGVRDNSFTIRTDKPGVTVFWQVTGVRQDAWANANRITPEEEKPAAERYRYLYPEAHGQPAGKSVFAPVAAAG